MDLKKNERIDDLQYKGLKIIQNKNGFCFGIDAVLLSDYAKEIKENSVVADLCTGTGIVAILLSGKINAKKIYGVEIQSDVAQMAKRSVVMNSLQDRVEIINKDVKDIEDVFTANSMDAVVINPPYKARNSGIINENDTKMISRHEISCALEDFIRKSAYILNSKGSLYMVHKPERLCDIVYYMRKYRLEPKRMRLVYSNDDKEATLLLIQAIKDGGKFLTVEKPLYVYDKDGEYTEEIQKIYNKI